MLMHVKMQIGHRQCPCIRYKEIKYCWYKEMLFYTYENGSNLWLSLQILELPCWHFVGCKEVTIKEIICQWKMLELDEVDLNKMTHSMGHHIVSKRTNTSQQHSQILFNFFRLKNLFRTSILSFPLWWICLSPCLPQVSFVPCLKIVQFCNYSNT